VAGRTATDASIITNQGQPETDNPHINIFHIQNALQLLKTKSWKDLVDAGEEEECLEHEVRVSGLAADLRPIFEDIIWLVLQYARQDKSEPDKGRQHQTLAQRLKSIEYSDMDEKARMLFTKDLDEIYQEMVSRDLNKDEQIEELKLQFRHKSNLPENVRAAYLANMLFAHHRFITRNFGY
jgi:hypothetical protein